MALITCSDITYGYNGIALTDPLSFNVNADDYLCIVGENGAGKSTLVKALLRLHKPLSGSISLGEGLKEQEIGYLPQQTPVQRDFPASVWEIVISGCQARCGLRPYYNKQERLLAKSNIQKLGLSEVRDSCYRELSGGQQQRVLLARALCATQKLLLLDEPASGLDPKATLELYQLIADLNKQENITIIMISHDIKAALRYATHILHIGRHPYYGTTTEYLNTPLWKSFLALEGGNF